MSKLLSVGRMSKLFGGGILLNLYDRFPAQFDMKEPLFVLIDKLEVPLFLESFQKRGNASAIVRFDDIDTDVRMSEMLGLEVFLPDMDDDQIYDEPTDDAIYFEDLEGWTAVLSEGVSGEIVKFLDGDNPLFLVNVNGRDVFIPAVDEFFIDFNEEKTSVTFDLPEGLLDLYL